MIVLVPLSRFRVTYEVAAGRPFSEFESLILRAIQQGTTEVSALLGIFEVHPRLLIESLVTLTYAGWVSVGGPGHDGLVLTASGTEAAASDEPPSTIVVSSRRTSVVMERVTGALIPNQEIQFASQKDFADVWNSTVRLPTEVTANHLDEGQVQHLLPRNQNEWVRWIEPIEMLTKDANWLPVDVDLDSKSVFGLPQAWQQRLKPTVLKEAASRVAGLSATGNTKTSPGWRGRQRGGRARSTNLDETDTTSAGIYSWPTTLSNDDFLFTAAEHERLAKLALDEAETSILIASAFASPKKLDQLRDSIIGALQRGVDVDLLWGYVDGRAGAEPTRDLLRWLRQLSYDGRPSSLRFNSRPSDSHAKLMLWDRSDGTAACVGSYNWLSAMFDGADANLPLNATIRTLEPAIVASLARCAAGLWSSATDPLSTAGDRWRRIASSLEQASLHVDSSSANANVRLVLDRDHEPLLYDWTTKAQSRLLVASHKLGPISEARLVNANRARPGSFDYKVVFGRAGRDETWREGVTKTVVAANGVARHVKGFHGKALVSDRSACVSSYNFLSADPFGTDQDAREIGLAIDGIIAADWIWDRIAAAITDLKV